MLHKGVTPTDAAYFKQNFNVKQKELRFKLHTTLSKVGDDLGRRFTFNTAISSNMELLNNLNSFVINDALDQQVRQEVLDNVALMLSPIVPHITHTLWTELGHDIAIIEQTWVKLVLLQVHIYTTNSASMACITIL